jgi:outer membrane cobalamin receptor
MTISGARPQQNSYLIDGINVNDYLGGSPGGVEGGATGVDAIQEFSVLTSNYSAEYGRTSGGVINAVTNQHKTWMAFPSVAFTLGSQARWSLASGHAPQG